MYHLMTAIFILVSLASYVPNNAHAEGFGWIASATGQVARKIAYGRTGAEAIIEVGAAAIDDVVEAAVESVADRANHYGLDDYDLSQIEIVLEDGESHAVSTWNNPYSDIRYEAVPRPLAMTENGEVQREIVVRAAKRNAENINLRGIRADNGWVIKF
ncbi:MAG: hypothetical protein KKB70_08560 [Proteobacteria bacterium]|nr:hypothetical protein [Pseudomonadota bacterium]